MMLRGRLSTPMVRRRRLWASWTFRRCEVIAVLFLRGAVEGRAAEAPSIPEGLILPVVTSGTSYDVECRD